MQCFIGFRSDKTHAASLLSDFKDISGKACLKGVDNNDALILWMMEISIRKKHYRHMKLLFKKIKSHTCLEIFQSTNNINRREDGVLFQSFSEA